MLCLAGVKAVRYTGVAPKKLWEVGGRNVPVLERGDIVLVGETVAISLVRGGRRRMFEMIDGEISIDVEALDEIVEDEVIDGEISIDVEALDEIVEDEVIDLDEEAAQAEAEAKAAEEATTEENPQGDDGVVGDGETGTVEDTSNLPSNSGSKKRKGK